MEFEKIKIGDLIKYEAEISGSIMVSTGIVLGIDFYDEPLAGLLRVLWLDANEPEWIIYNKKIIKLIAEA